MASWHIATLALLFTVSAEAASGESTYASDIQGVDSKIIDHKFKGLEQWVNSWKQSEIQSIKNPNQQFNQEFKKHFKYIDENRTTNRVRFISLVEDIQTLIEINSIKLTSNNLANWTFLKAHKEALSTNTYKAIELHSTLAQHKDFIVRLRAQHDLLNMAIASDNYDVAIKNQKLLRDSLHSLTDVKTKNMVLLMLGYFYNHVGEYKLSEQVQSKIAYAKLSPRQQCMMALHRLDTAIGLGNFQSVSIALNAGEYQCLKIEEPLLFNAILIESSEFYLNNQQVDKAEKLIKTYKNLMLDNHYHYLANQKLLLAYYWRIGDKNQTQTHAKNLEQHLVELRARDFNSKWVRESYQLLSTYYFEKENIEKAQDYLMLYKEQLQHTLKLEVAKSQARENMRQAQILEDNKRIELKESLMSANEKQQEAHLALQAGVQNRVAVQFSLFAIAVMILVLYVYMRRYLRILGPLKKQQLLDSISGALSRESFVTLAEIYLPKWFNRQSKVGAIVICIPANQESLEPVSEQEVPDEYKELNRPSNLGHFSVNNTSEVSASGTNTEQTNLSKHRLLEYQNQLMMQETVAVTTELVTKTLEIKQPEPWPCAPDFLSKLKMLHFALFKDGEYRESKKSFLLARTSYRKFTLLLSDTDKDQTLALANALHKRLCLHLARENVEIGVTHSDNSGHRFRYIMMDLIAALQKVREQKKAKASVQDLAFCPQTIIESPNYRDNQSTSLFKQDQPGTGNHERIEVADAEDA